MKQFEAWPEAPTNADCIKELLKDVDAIKQVECVIESLDEAEDVIDKLEDFPNPEAMDLACGFANTLEFEVLAFEHKNDFSIEALKAFDAKLIDLIFEVEMTQDNLEVFKEMR